MKRNKHSLSHYRLQSMDMGALVPIGSFEVLPGDTVQHSTAALVRASPLLSPVMHPIQVRIHHWFVPYRLCWSSWENFITGGPDGMNASTFPTVSFVPGAPSLGGLADYLGVPPAGVGTTVVSALPWRAYALIWNNNYRDEDLETPVAVSLADGADSTTSLSLLNCDWEKDYFTSARPWEQKGPAVSIPLGTTAPVVSTSVPPTWRGTAAGPGGQNLVPNSVGPSAQVLLSGTSADTGALRFGTTTGLQTDLTGASAVTVSALRQALAIQRFEEARARYGSRYTEYLRYLGVRSSDARLQRPEYLGGGRQTIQFSEVLQTGPSATPDQANTVGALKGHGLGAMRSNRYRRFFEEHGIVISLMSIRPKTIYQDGLPRHLNRRVKEDFWQKELEHIGQQAIKNKEIYRDHASPDATFGWQDRYDEYRRQESGVAGEFRTTLNYWHLSRIFGSAPALNASFVSCVPTLRTFASASTDPFYVMANHSIQARRLVAATGKSFIF